MYRFAGALILSVGLVVGWTVNSHADTGGGGGGGCCSPISKERVVGHSRLVAFGGDGSGAGGLGSSAGGTGSAGCGCGMSGKEVEMILKQQSAQDKKDGIKLYRELLALEEDNLAYMKSSGPDENCRLMSCRKLREDIVNKLVNTAYETKHTEGVNDANVINAAAVVGMFGMSILTFVNSLRRPRQRRSRLLKIEKRQLESVV